MHCAIRTIINQDPPSRGRCVRNTIFFHVILMLKKSWFAFQKIGAAHATTIKYFGRTSWGSKAEIEIILYSVLRTPSLHSVLRTSVRSITDYNSLVRAPAKTTTQIPCSGNKPAVLRTRSTLQPKHHDFLHFLLRTYLWYSLCIGDMSACFVSGRQ